MCVASAWSKLLHEPQVATNGSDALHTLTAAPGLCPYSSRHASLRVRLRHPSCGMRDQRLENRQSIDELEWHHSCCAQSRHNKTKTKRNEKEIKLALRVTHIHITHKLTLTPLLTQWPQKLSVTLLHPVKVEAQLAMRGRDTLVMEMVELKFADMELVAGG